MQSDNGLDVNWKGAQRFCAGRTGGCRLPNVDELLSIYAASESLGTRCLSFTCKVSPLFHLSSDWVWSGPKNGSSVVWGVNLVNRSKFNYFTILTPGGGRALCARRPNTF